MESAARRWSTAADAPGVVDDFEGSDAELRAEIDRLGATNRRARTAPRRAPAARSRHIAGIRALGRTGPAGAPRAGSARLPEEGVLPEFAADELTPGARARGDPARRLHPRPRARRSRRGAALRATRSTVRSWSARRFVGGQPAAEGYYEEFLPGTPEYEEALTVRPWIREGGGVLAVDSPDAVGRR